MMPCRHMVAVAINGLMYGLQLSIVAREQRQEDVKLNGFDVLLFTENVCCYLRS